MLDVEFPMDVYVVYCYSEITSWVTKHKYKRARDLHVAYDKERVVLSMFGEYFCSVKGQGYQNQPL